jgi:N-acetylmuramic acid 6-phosphate etherase
MLKKLLTEQSNPASEHIDRLETVDMMTLMNQADAEIAAAVDAIAARLKTGGHLTYIGAGTSGRLGVLDASECPPTFNVSPELVQGIIAGGERALTRAVEGAEDDPELGALDLIASGFGAEDAVVGIAASGRTPYVLGAIEAARKLGALTVGISCTTDSELSSAVDIPIEPKPGPEMITGSTRLRAGTATKMVLNMISTGVMIKLGHVYGNLMVNVQPTNKKLEDRARRIIAQAAGVSEARAAELLAAAGKDVRRAIEMGKNG